MLKLDLKIRSAGVNDIASIQRRLKRTGLYFEPVDGYKELYEDQLRLDPESIVVVERGSSIVGVVFFVFSPLLTHVFHLAVAARYRRKGIGAMLLREVEDRVRKNGGNYISSYIEKGNKASLKLCDSLEFEKYNVGLVARYKEVR